MDSPRHHHCGHARFWAVSAELAYMEREIVDSLSPAAAVDSEFTISRFQVSPAYSLNLFGLVTLGTI